VTTRVVEPLSWPPDAVVVLPGSKSITNRALVCAALARGRSVLTGALLADDTAAMIDGLRTLGAVIEVEESGSVPVLVVTGTGGAGVVSPVRLEARLSGTTSRFLLAVAAAVASDAVIDGREPLRRRPMADGLDALMAAGVEVQSNEGCLPVRLRGGRPWPSELRIGGSVSSQFLSGLLLAAPVAGPGCRIVVEGELRSRPYVEMTLRVMEQFGVSVISTADGRTYDVPDRSYRAASWSIEPDASAASYPLAVAAATGGRVTIEGLGSASIQGDARFVDVLAAMGSDVDLRSRSVTVVGPRRLSGGRLDMGDISDTAQTLAAIAPFADAACEVTGIGFIRGKETDRIDAVVTELGRLGIVASNEPDGFRIEPGLPRCDVAVATYEDHRMAMSFAVTGLVGDGICIADAEVVDKTFPRFFEVMEMLRRPSVVAIDGPAGSGKSTVARRVADVLDLPYLDTGAMYRAVTWAVLDRGLDPTDTPGVVSLCLGLQIVVGDRVAVDGVDVTEAIRGPEVTESVSAVSAIPGVRSDLRDRQRAWMVAAGGGVVEGRDIGTVVFPDAPVKIFLTATPNARAARRAAERGDARPSEIARVADELATRDLLDSTRDDSPLLEARDAVSIDTTALGIDEVVEAIRVAFAERAAWRTDRDR